jgi:ABC-type lipoprotein release transport system permease subunit
MNILLNAIQLVIRRSWANWRLLSSILVGVLVAVAILSSTPLYSNALNDLGLRHALSNVSIELLDIEVYSGNNPIDRTGFNTQTAFVNQQVDSYIGNLIHQKEQFIMSPSYNAMVAGETIPTDTSTRPTGYFQSFTNLEKHVNLVAGRFPRYAGNIASPDEAVNLLQLPDKPTGIVLPEDITQPDLEIEGMISPKTADLMHVGVGDTIIFFSAGGGGDPVYINTRIVGLIEPIDPGDEFWFLRKDLFDVPADEHVTVPMFIPQDTVFEVLSTVIPKDKLGYHWYFYVDPSRVESTQAKAIINAVQYVESMITTQITNATVFTSLDSTIYEYLQKQLYTQIPLYLLVFQIAAIIFYYVVTVASMVIEQETGEIALLRSRGASTFQIFGIFLIEGLLISAVGGIAGPFLGAFVFGMLGKTAAFLPLTGGNLLPIRFTTTVFILAGVAAGLCLFAFMVPAIQAARRGIVHHRQMVARPPRAPVWQRYYLDIILLVAGGGLYYELQQRGTLVNQHILGDLGIDPLMLITPLLFMLAVAIIFLRLFPLLIRFVSWLSRYITNSVVVLTLRYMARNPTHYSRLILLLMLAASVGMFSASFLGTLSRSYTERVDYTVGADVRLERPLAFGMGKTAMIEHYSKVPGVETFSLAYRGSATVGTFTQTDSTILAIDPATLDTVSWYRDDFSEKTKSELMNILKEDTPAPSGIALPDGTLYIGLWIKPVYSPNPNLTLHARIENGRGYYQDVPIGSLQYNDWQYIEGDLLDIFDQAPIYPLRLHCIYVSVSSTGPGFSTSVSQGIYLDEIQVRGDFSPGTLIIEDFDDVSRWTAVSEAQQSSSVPAGYADSISKERNIVYASEFAARYSFSSRSGFKGIFPDIDSRPHLAIASRSFLTSVGVSVGDYLTIRIPGQFVNITIEEVVDYFPTLNPEDKPFLLLNYDRLLKAGLSSNNRLYPNEVWLDVTDDAQEREAAIKTLTSPGYKAEKFYDKEAILAAQKEDPLVAAGWGGILLISFIGVVLVSGLGFIVYAYLSARGRHLEFAVLRTLGFSWKQIISLVCFEQVFVIGLGMGIGTLLGNRLSRIMMPFLQLTEKGETVIPPFLVVTDWTTIGIAYIILSIAFIATISLVVLFFSKVALHRALRLGDE